MKIGISIITCSIKPELCNQMLESVRNTIGTNYEEIIFDNRDKNLSMCHVYNHCAQKAKYPYLCFLHEDILILTPNWGITLIGFAKNTQNCGVVGFAGGTIAKRNFVGWVYGPKGRYRYYDPANNNRQAKTVNDLCLRYNNPENENFSKVITLDGFFIFTSREVWEDIKFDEERIKGFHVYDADFTFNVALKRQNYVCLNMDIYHFSSGNRDKAYFENTRIFQKKWKQKLPYIIGKQKITWKEEMGSAIYLFVQSIQCGFALKDCIKHFLVINNFFFFLLFCIIFPVWKVRIFFKNMFYLSF